MERLLVGPGSLTSSRKEMNKTNSNIYIDAFDRYKVMGLDPLPIPYEQGLPSKVPLIPGWQRSAEAGIFTADDFSKPCNMGVLLGGKFHLTDIDLDSPEAVAVGRDILREYEATLNFGRDSKPRSHHIYSSDASLATERIKDPTDSQCIVEYRCVNKDGKRGQQSVFPPSIRYDTANQIVEEIRLEKDSPSTPAFIESAKLYSAFREIAAVSLLAKHFPGDGDRHDTILSLAGLFVGSKVEEKRAARMIELSYRHSKGYNSDCGRVKADVESVYNSHAEEPDSHLYGYPKLIEVMPTAVVDKVLALLDLENPNTAYNLTDAGNGRRLVDKHKDEIRYCVDDCEWYVWDGVRWRKDVIKKMREMAKGIAADIRKDAAKLKYPTFEDDEEAKKEPLARQEARKREFLKWANQTENADRVSKTILSAASDPRITCFLADFDHEAHLLNCPNGVVDLLTGKLAPHDRAFMMSNLCPVEYDPGATHPVWSGSLAAFTRKHDDLLPFLKRVAGYSIQGNKTEERIFVLHGPGSSGKGTFIDWLTNALGPDYAIAMDSSSVLKQKRDSAAASGDIIRLAGKRIAIVSEIEKGSKLQESFMKLASGNDAIVARGMYASEREFRPTHQFWFQTNYRPGFDAIDSGNKRRYLEIPFDNDLRVDPLVTFDSKLKVAMRNNPDFLKAVLAWCVQGCVEWREKGLEIPPSVTAATAALFAENDFLTPFIRDMCVVAPDERISVKDLWDCYRRWCEGQGEEPAQGRTFNRMLEERGFGRKQARHHGSSVKVWMGIRAKEHDELVHEAADEESLSGTFRGRRYSTEKDYTHLFRKQLKVE